QDLSDCLARIERRKCVKETWSTGNRQDLPIGSRVFLLRQGKDPRGIVASGFALSEPEPSPNEEERSFYADFVFSMVLDDVKGHLLCLDELLNTPLLVNVPWGIPSGGREFSSSEAAQLEMLWASVLGRLGRSELPHNQDFPSPGASS